MKISKQIILDYLNIGNLTNEKIYEALISIGVEVEHYFDFKAKNSNIFVGQILELEKHPKSDKLNVCKVRISNSKILQIVCGAPNVFEGAKVVVSIEGSKLANGMTIENTVIRDIDSYGMICSYEEIGVEKLLLNSKDQNGIIILPEEAVVGDNNPLHYIGMDDCSFELSVTSNRGDLLSIYGLLKELSSHFNCAFRLPKLNETISKIDENFNLKIISKQVKNFSHLKIENVDNSIETPSEIKHALIKLGIKPVSFLVDLGNYVMIETGQPIHVYDNDQIHNSLIISDDVINTEFIALNNQSYITRKGDIVIMNKGKVACLAGIIGSLEYGITKNVKNIIVEAASFDNLSIQNTCLNQKVSSDASLRFSKFVDEHRISVALYRFYNLLKKYNKDTIVSKSKKFGSNSTKPIKIKITKEYINHQLGTNLSTEEIKKIFERLYFRTTGTKTLIVNITTDRYDIKNKIDLVEEVLKIYGVNKIESKAPNQEPIVITKSKTNKLIDKSKQFMKFNQFYEVKPYNLVNSKVNVRFNTFNLTDPIKIKNPISENREEYALSSLPKILDILKHNIDRKQPNFNLFCIEDIYSKHKSFTSLGFIYCSPIFKLSFDKNNTIDTNLISLKGIINSLLNSLGLDKSIITMKEYTDKNKIFHPHQTIAIYSSSKLVGFFGKAHPIIEQENKLENIFYGELNLTDLELNTKRKEFEDISIYPDVTRSFSFSISDSVKAGSILTFLNSKIKYISHSEIFDIFTLENGRKSISIKVIFNGVNRTLTDKDITDTYNEIIAIVEEHFDAKFRN